MENTNITPETASQVPATIQQKNDTMLVFSSQANFEQAQRMAQALAASTIVPVQYQKSKTPEAVANCIIALEMANRIGMSPLLVMQNLYVVYGNVGWSSKFLIAALNTCGRFSPLRYEHENEGDLNKWRCRAWAIDKTTGTPLHGAWVSIKMAKDEGWYDKNGSKWKTMPELMLQYRAAAFFQRTYAPEISMGMQTVEELNDVVDASYEDVTNKPQAQPFDASKIQSEADINTALLRGQISKEEADYFREQLTKSKAAADIIAAAEAAQAAANDAEPQDGLFQKNKEDRDGRNI